MKILLSNDDGVYAKGIAVLAECLAEMAEITIVAPDRNRSGASNSLTLHSPLHTKELRERVISVEGTPTDCVHLAITGLLDEEPDMVVSGINEGANLGDDTLYSGTVAAASEGRFLGLPAIAVSLVGKHCMHYQTAGIVARLLVKKLRHAPLPSDTILNVNVPDIPFEEIQGFEITRLGTRHMAEKAIEMKDPRGNPIFWIGPAGPEADAGPGTDFYAVNNNRVSITPLKMDLTNHHALESVGEWLGDLTSQTGG